MIGIAVGALTLCVTMFLVGRYEAEIDLKVNFGIAVVVGMVTFLLSIPLGLFAVSIGFALCTYLIYKFCYLGWGKSALVALSFL